MDKIDVKICCGIHCSVRGGQELLDALELEPILSTNCVYECVNCLGCCDEGKTSPVIEINGACYTQMTPERLLDTISSMLTGSQS